MAQSADASAPQRKSLLEAVPAAVPGLIIAAILLLRCLFAYAPQVLHGGLVDTDSYMHIIRLRDLVANGAWHAGFFARDNAPFGMVLHWSKAYDIMALALAAPIAAVAGWHTAFTIIAPVIGPLSIAALIIAACWAVAPVCPKPEQALVGILIAIAPSIFANGQIGDCDHHVTVTAAWVLFLGCALRVALRPQRPGPALAAGLTATFALWISVECILGVCLGVALIALVWVRDGAIVRRASLVFGFSFAISMIAVLLFDPPYDGLTHNELDRFALVHVVFAILVALLFAALALAPQQPDRWRARFLLLVGGSIVAAAALVLLFPGLIRPEEAMFREDDIPGFWEWNDINEMKPAFQYLDGGLLFMGGPFIGLVSALGLVWARWGTREAAAWAFMALMLATTGALALLHIRFAMYPETLAAFPAAIALNRIGAFVGARSLPNWRRQAEQAAAAAIIVAGPFIAFAIMSWVAPHPSTPEPACDVHVVAPALNDVAFMGGSKLVMVTDPNQAPEVLYWTDHGVVFGPYHTNRDGLRDLARFLTSDDDKGAREVAARRGVAYVMLCGKPPAKPAAGESGAAADVGKAEELKTLSDQKTLYRRLLRGEVPDWLRAQPWPGHVTSDLHLFKVLSPG